MSEPNIISGVKVVNYVVGNPDKNIRGIIDRQLQEFDPSGNWRSSLSQMCVEIVRFEPEPDATPQQETDAISAQDSANAKIRTFQKLGMQVQERVIPTSTSPRQFKALIDRYNDTVNVRGVIVQNPIPQRLQSIVRQDLDPKKDLDAQAFGSRFKVPATSTAAVRVLDPFLRKDIIIAVVGSEGFVGSGIVKQLRELGYSKRLLKLDRENIGYTENDLYELKNCSIIINTVGNVDKVGFITEQHLSNKNELVIDVGYIPSRTDPKLKQGGVSISKTAVDVPKNITPVPGGMGPIEMAILSERIIDRVSESLFPGRQFNLKPWKITEIYPNLDIDRL
jgi:methylenetetrahydrofolate dehydrogenase (NADP+) / methenyltetrahydrofolate cyclohydrolase